LTPDAERVVKCFKVSLLNKNFDRLNYYNCHLVYIY
jgi:hypothetical protein